MPSNSSSSRTSRQQYSLRRLEDFEQAIALAEVCDTDKCMSTDAGLNSKYV